MTQFGVGLWKVDFMDFIDKYVILETYILTFLLKKFFVGFFAFIYASFWVSCLILLSYEQELNFLTDGKTSTIRMNFIFLQISSNKNAGLCIIREIPKQLSAFPLKVYSEKNGFQVPTLQSKIMFLNY